jgi:hypothetical protein
LNQQFESKPMRLVQLLVVLLQTVRTCAGERMLTGVTVPQARLGGSMQPAT